MRPASLPWYTFAVVLATLSCKASELIDDGSTVATVQVTPAGQSIAAGTAIQLTATPRNSAGTAVTGATFTWTSSNSRATVSQAGLVTGVSAGVDTISATTQGIVGSTIITVTAVVGGGGVASVSVQPSSASISAGSTQLLAATPLDSLGQQVTAGVTWTASNGKATVLVNPSNSHAATVTGVAVGVDTITATSGTHNGTSIITVTAVAIGTITLSPLNQTIDAAGATVQLTAVVKSPQGVVLTGVPLTWTSSNTAIARVDSTGFLTSALIHGTVNVTATSGGKIGTTSFNVVLRWREIATSNGLTTDSVGHTCGITLLGAGYCWGNNSTGQSGIGSNVNWNGPQAVIGSIAFTSIATGVAHTCGINTQGAAYCWGFNGSGQLGTGSNAQAFIPTLVTGGLVLDSTSITTGREHSCALTAAGQAYCWGLNTSGQLGDASNSTSNAPVAVSGGHIFTSISAGTFHTCGITTGGVAYCWGLNGNSQLGDNSVSPSNTPVAVAGGVTFTAISGGGAHTCGVATSGNIYCWGLNADGQLGTANLTPAGAPIQVFGGQVYSTVDAGAQSTCAILAGGGAGPSGKCWGGNLGYQIGNGDTVSVAQYVTPTAIQAPTASKITMGSRHACIVTTSSLIYCWGRNREGQVGIGSFSSAALPNVATPAKGIGQP